MAEWEDAPASKSSGWEDAPSKAPAKQYGMRDLAAGQEMQMAMGSGMAAQIASGYAGIAGAIAPGPAGQGADWQQRTADALTYRPRGKIADTATRVAGVPGEVLDAIAGSAGQFNSDLVHPAYGALTKGTIEAAAAALGGRSGTSRVPTPAEGLATKYRNQGFSTTPAEGGGGVVARTVENLAGADKLAKQVSEKNIPVVSDKIGGELGLPKGAPITQEALAKVEKGAWDKYAAVRKSGRITTDAEYTKALDKVQESYKSAATDFPEAAKKLGINDTAEMVDSLRKGSFDANSAVDMVRNLRESANKAYADRNGAHARALRQASKAIEDQIERHLERPQMSSDGSGFPVKSAVLEEFKDARTTLAKVHDARKALDKNENLNPQVYAESLRRNPTRLSGGSREVAEFARDNPRSAQKVVSLSDVKSTLGIGDIGLGLATGGYHMLAHGLTGGAAIPASAAIVARPATRALLASRAGQSLLEQRHDVPKAIARGLAISEMQKRRLSDEIK